MLALKVGGSYCDGYLAMLFDLFPMMDGACASRPDVALGR